MSGSELVTLDVVPVMVALTYGVASDRLHPMEPGSLIRVEETEVIGIPWSPLVDRESTPVEELRRFARQVIRYCQ